MGRNGVVSLRTPRNEVSGIRGFNISLDYCSWDFLRPLSIFLEQRIAATKGYRGGRHVRGLEDDEVGLFDVLFKLESSLDVFVCLCVAAAKKRRKRNHVQVLFKKMKKIFRRGACKKLRIVCSCYGGKMAIVMQVTLHDKRVVMQVTLHYEATVVQVTLHDKRIVMQVTLHYEAIVMQVTLHDKRIVMQVTLHYEAIVMQVTLHDKRMHKSSGKSTQAEELEFDDADTEMHRDQGKESSHIDDQPNNEAAPEHDWFQKPDKPPTHDRPAFNLLKGTCKSFAELEYHFEECYKAVNDRLVWYNPEGCEYPFDLSKPLPLIEVQGRQVVPANYFINNDLEYLKAGSSTSKYTTSITRTKAAKYDNIEGIEDMVPTLWSLVKVAYNNMLSREHIIGVQNDKDSMHMHATGNLHMMSTPKEELL
uniref:Uncharacterized protein n=1 Tax=Tanacetum cinerariifolium TaxID=118510 RepID=A0A6L2J3J6_TANCI|nr:hypothetical protein [Tanacetum cinerariifolium]